MQSPGLSGSQGFGEDAAEDTDSPGHVERSRFLEEYSKHRPLSAGMRPRLLNKVAHAAMGYGVAGDDSEGDGDTDPWTLDGWGDEPSVPEKARQASTKLLSKWLRNIPCTLPSTNAPGRRIMSAGPHRSPQPTSGGRGTRAVWAAGVGAGPDGVGSPSKLGARRQVYVPQVRRAIKPIADLEVGDESDIEPEQLVAQTAAARSLATAQAASAARRVGRGAGPVGSGGGAAPAHSTFNAMSVLGAGGREHRGGGAASAQNASSQVYPGVLSRQDSNSSGGTYDGELPSDASNSQINSARQATGSGAGSGPGAGAPVDAVLSPGLRPVARPPVPQPMSPLKHLGTGVGAAGQQAVTGHTGGGAGPGQGVVQGPGPGPPADDGSQGWKDSPRKDSPRSGGGAVARNTSAAAAAASQAVSQNAVALAAAQQAVALEAATAAARSAVKAKLQQDLENLMARRSALHKPPSGTSFSSPQQPPAAPGPSAPGELAVGPSPGRLRRVSSSGGNNGAGAGSGVTSAYAGGNHPLGLPQPGLGVAITGVGVGPPGLIPVGGGLSGDAGLLRKGRVSVPQGAGGGGGPAASMPPRPQERMASGSKATSSPAPPASSKPPAMMVEGGGIGAWDTDSPSGAPYGIMGGDGGSSQWPPPRPAAGPSPAAAGGDSGLRGPTGGSLSTGARVWGGGQSPGGGGSPSHAGPVPRRPSLTNSPLASGQLPGQEAFGAAGVGGAALRRAGSENAGGRSSGGPIPMKQFPVDGVNEIGLSQIGLGRGGVPMPPAGPAKQRSMK